MKGWILAVAALAGCSGADADVAGNYTVALTNGENGCMFANWTVGAQATGIPMIATQDGSKLTVTIEGGARIYLELLLGSGKNVFSGTVDGDDISVESIGTRAATTGNCTYTYNSKISGTLDGDVLRGRIEYRAADNGNSDCTTVHGCLTSQEYNGTRPPQ